MTAATGNVNRALHGAVSTIVAGYFADSGLDATARPHMPRGSRPSGVLAAEFEHGAEGDVRGVDDVWIGVTSRQAFKPADDLDRARTGADVTGRTTAVAIQWRSGRPAADAYALLSLRDLVRLLGGTPPP